MPSKSPAEVHRHLVGGRRGAEAMRPASHPQTGADVSQGPLQARRTGLPRRPAAEAGESQQAADGHGLVLDLFFFVVFGGAEPATVGRARPAESQFHFLLVVESVVSLHQSLHHNSLQVGLYLILFIQKKVELKKWNRSHSGWTERAAFKWFAATRSFTRKPTATRRAPTAKNGTADVRATPKMTTVSSHN